MTTKTWARRPKKGRPNRPARFQFAREVVEELIKIIRERQRQEAEEAARRQAEEERKAIEKAAQEMIDGVNRAMQRAMRSFSSAPPPVDFGDSLRRTPGGPQGMSRDIQMSRQESQAQEPHER